MDVGNGNPAMDKKNEEDIEFGHWILIQSHVLGGANRKWMFVMEIRLWREKPKRSCICKDGRKCLPEMRRIGPLEESMPPRPAKPDDRDASLVKIR